MGKKLQKCPSAAIVFCPKTPADPQKGPSGFNLSKNHSTSSGNCAYRTHCVSQKPLSRRPWDFRPISACSAPLFKLAQPDTCPRGPTYCFGSDETARQSSNGSDTCPDSTENRVQWRHACLLRILALTAVGGWTSLVARGGPRVWFISSFR